MVILNSKTFTSHSDFPSDAMRVLSKMSFIHYSCFYLKKKKKIISYCILDTYYILAHYFHSESWEKLCILLKSSFTWCQIKKKLYLSKLFILILSFKKADSFRYKSVVDVSNTSHICDLSDDEIIYNI